MVDTDTAKLVAHVDLDAFFASCEQRDNPGYRGRPVIVGALPGRRGVVAAASYEARRFGIHSAMPIADAYRRCPDGVYVNPDMHKYRMVSEQVFAILRDITPAVEAASIDEAYLDVSGLEKLLGPPATIGQVIKDRIYAGTALTASVGIGPNRLIAKLGSEHRKPDGLTVVEPHQVLDFLAPMPVGNLRGVGRQTRKIFDQLGISTVADLRAASSVTLASHLGQRVADGVRRQALGQASADIVPGRVRKSISKERTFETDISAPRLLHDVLRELSAAVAATARREVLAGRVVVLKIRYTGFETHTRQKTLPAATQDERVLLKHALALLNDGNLPVKPVRLIGIGLSDLAEPAAAQPDLFSDTRQTDGDQRVLDTIDRVTAKFGANKLQLGLTRRSDR